MAFPGQSWLTFRQALALGGHARKGECGTTVVYADRFVPDDEENRTRETGKEAQAVPFLKRFTVFIGEGVDTRGPHPAGAARVGYGNGLLLGGFAGPGSIKLSIREVNDFMPPTA